MRRIYALVGTLVTLLVGVLPALADDGDPLANSTMLPGWFALAMVGLALLLIIIFALLARRGTA